MRPISILLLKEFMMDRFNPDPGLPEAYTQQSHQRLINIARNERLAKSVKNDNAGQSNSKQLSLVWKLKVIGQIVRDSGSDIITIVKTKNDTINV
jgi:hypothetical protein